MISGVALRVSPVPSGAVALCSGGEGNEIGASLGAALGDLAAAGDEWVFFSFGGFGVGVWRTKRRFSLSPSVSSFSSVARANGIPIAKAIEISKMKRSLLFAPTVSRLCGQLLKHRLIHANAGLEIFQRKILVRRMRAAILQRETD